MARMTRTPVQGTTPVGAYSPGIIAEGRFLYVSGQGPLVDGKYDPASVGDETRLTLENIGRILASAGAGFDDVVRCGCFLADINDFDAMNSVYSTYFSEPRPARTTVQVAALPGGIKVEIDCIALLPE
jgi:2-iminobutanoate/2-iminopropanoate deaminase